ncbi:MAG TPA: DsbE family thiol:disulfide interchange protein [Steroidobacteraceae bacterium]|nr:DsbE family thiol:disulfide interchange protein [Steroidobacteraceae bacterium]
MWRYFAPAVAFLALGGLFAYALMRIDQGKLDIREIQSPLIGKAAPSFVLPSLTDPPHQIDSHALAGKPYILNVWGTWCGECRAEHPALMTLARTIGLPIIGLDWKDEHSDARAYLAQLGNPYAEVAADDVGRTAIDWGVYGAPETFLVSADGIVLAKHIGAISEAVWEKKFAPHLKNGGRS